MKTGIKLTIFAAVLCVGATAALIGYWFVHESQQPGKYGRNLEFRLLALNADNESQISGESTTRSGDAFSGADAQKWIASGDAPTGWKWLPVIDSLQATTMAGLGAGEISRSNDGSEFLLAGDSNEIALTHRAGAPSWGIKSAEAHSSESGPAVAIILDNAGGDLMYQLTQKHIGRSMAVVVDGKICMVAKIMTPIRGAIEVTLPQGQLREAEELRNVLLSGRN